MQGRDKVGMKDFDLLKVLGTGGRSITNLHVIDNVLIFLQNDCTFKVLFLKKRKSRICGTSMKSWKTVQYQSLVLI